MKKKSDLMAYFAYKIYACEFNYLLIFYTVFRGKKFWFPKSLQMNENKNFFKYNDNKKFKYSNKT